MNVNDFYRPVAQCRSDAQESHQCGQGAGDHRAIRQGQTGLLEAPRRISLMLQVLFASFSLA